MVQEHFSELTNGASIKSRNIWECTRFCVSPGAGPNVAPALMLGGLCLGLGQGLSHAVGVFDARMIGVYKRLGWAPAVLGQTGTQSTGIAAVATLTMAITLRRMRSRRGAHWIRSGLLREGVAVPRAMDRLA